MADKQQEKNDKQQEKTDKQPEKKFDKGKQRRPQQQMAPAVSASGKEVKGIVRLAGRDLNGGLRLKRALTSIKGIGINLGDVVAAIAYKHLGLSDQTLVGELSEEEIEKLEHLMYNLNQHGVPIRMFNRQKDIFTGNDTHVISTDLTYIVKQDIDHERDAYTWKGYRHTYGQKVRGQRTRSTGRTGMTVGVLRKAILAKAGGAVTAQTGAAAQAAGAAPAAGGAVKAPTASKAGVAPKAGAAPKAAAPAKKEEAKK